MEISINILFVVIINLMNKQINIANTIQIMKTLHKSTYKVNISVLYYTFLSIDHCNVPYESDTIL